MGVFTQRSVWRRRSWPGGRIGTPRRDWLHSCELLVCGSSGRLSKHDEQLDVHRVWSGFHLQGLWRWQFGGQAGEWAVGRLWSI